MHECAVNSYGFSAVATQAMLVTLSLLASGWCTTTMRLSEFRRKTLRIEPNCFAFIEFKEAFRMPFLSSNELKKLSSDYEPGDPINLFHIHLDRRP